MAEVGQRLELRNGAEWRCWLATHHASSPSVWLQFEKVGSPDRLTYVEAAEEALCFGWIDGQVRSIDTTCYLRLSSPRRPTSDWSQLNVNGHQFLPVGGHENCPVAVTRTARWRPWDLPRGLVAATRSSSRV